MRRRAALVLLAVIGSVAIVLAITLPWHHAPCPVSIQFVGYTRTPTSNVALFQITNRSALMFVCSVSPRDGSKTQLGGTLPVRAVPALGPVELTVPLPADTNTWRFNVEFRQLHGHRKWDDWEFRMRVLLRRIGMPSSWMIWRKPGLFNRPKYQLLTSALPQPSIDFHGEGSESTNWFPALRLE